MELRKRKKEENLTEENLLPFDIVTVVPNNAKDLIYLYD